jgi:hypothetical protein
MQSSVGQAVAAKTLHASIWKMQGQTPMAQTLQEFQHRFCRAWHGLHLRSVGGIGAAG